MSGELRLGMFRFTQTADDDMVIGSPVNYLNKSNKYLVFQVNQSIGYASNPHIRCEWNSGLSGWQLKFSNNGSDISQFVLTNTENTFEAPNVFQAHVDFNAAVNFNALASFDNLSVSNLNLSIGNLVSDHVICTNASAKLVSSTVTKTELETLSGVSSSVQTQLNSKAPLASPALSGTPTTPTATTATNSLQIASTAFVRDVIAQIPVDSSNKLLVVDDNATSSHVFPLWSTSSSSYNAIKVSSGSISVIPSTGELFATRFVGSGSGLTDIQANQISGGFSNVSFNLGTTSVNLGRPSGEMSLSGIVGIDGSSVSIGSSSASTINIGASTVDQTINIGTGSGISTINIGNTGDIVNIKGDITWVAAENLQVSDKQILLNKGGLANSAQGSGFLVEEDGSNAASIAISGSRASWAFTTPGKSGSLYLTPCASPYIADITVPTMTNSRSYTLPDRSGTFIISSDTGTVSNAMLANSSITLGTTPIALGSTTYNISGLNTITANVFNGTATNANKAAVLTQTAVNTGDLVILVPDGSSGAWTSAFITHPNSLVSDTFGILLHNASNGSFPEWTVVGSSSGLFSPICAQAAPNGVASPSLAKVGSIRASQTQVAIGGIDPISDASLSVFGHTILGTSYTHHTYFGGGTSSGSIHSSIDGWLTITGGSVGSDTGVYVNSTSHVSSFIGNTLVFRVNSTGVGVTGDITATGTVVGYYGTSDIRLKTNIRPIESALAKLDKISGVYFNYNELANSVASLPTDKDFVGVIAQDLESVLPEAVFKAPFATESEDYKMVQYDRIVPLLIQAIKEQQVEINILKSRIL